MVSIHISLSIASWEILRATSVETGLMENPNASQLSSIFIPQAHHMNYHLAEVAKRGRCWWKGSVWQSEHMGRNIGGSLPGRLSSSPHHVSPLSFSYITVLRGQVYLRGGTTHFQVWTFYLVWPLLTIIYTSISGLFHFNNWDFLISFHKILPIIK